MADRRHPKNRRLASFPAKAAALVAFLSLALLLSLGTGGCATAQIRPRPADFQRPYSTVMTVTGYCNCRKCCSWRYNWYGCPVFSAGPNAGRPKKIGMTASGTRAHPGTLAADTSRYPFGTIIYIPGYGYGRVEDRGGAIKGDHVDAWFLTHERAMKWGKKRLPVKVWIPKGTSRKR